MAGDWLKIEEGLPEKPEVWRIAADLDLDPDAVVGKLIRVWAMASRQCHADGVTDVTMLSQVDRASGVTGFAHAMRKVGWLVITDDSIQFPRFDRHMSKPSKDRALARDRQRKSRNGHGDVTEVSRSDRDMSRAREEKRRDKDLSSKDPAQEEDSEQKHKFKFEQCDRELAGSMAGDMFAISGRRISPQKLDEWSNVVRLMRERDRLSLDQISAAWRWLREGCSVEFLARYVTTPQRLRQKWDDVCAAKRQAAAPKPTTRQQDRDARKEDLERRRAENRERLKQVLGSD